MSDQFATEPTNRDAHTVLTDLANEYDRSLTTGVDWNGDAYRKILGFIIDATRLAGNDVSISDARAEIARREAAANPAPVAPVPSSVGSYPTADAIAAALLRQARESGTPVADVVRAHSTPPADAPAVDQEGRVHENAPVVGTDAG